MAKMRQAAGPKREDPGDEVAKGQQKIFSMPGRPVIQGTG